MFAILLVSVFAFSEVSGQFGLDSLGGICNLKEFINLKCPGRDNTSCVLCVFQIVIRKCPYDFLSGLPDCEKLRACGQNLKFNC
jgi:hypothetical protein